MDEDPNRAQRKHSFTPKKLGARKKKQIEHKHHEAMEDDKADDEIPENLIRRVNEHLTRERPRAEKKAKEVAFTHGVSQLRTFGKPREESGRSGGAVSRDPGLDNKQEFSSASSSSRAPILDNKQELLSLPSTAEIDGVVDSSEASVNALLQKKKEYKEPWDYHHSNYPVTLPLRRPYSGDPELLDEAEFGDDAANMMYDENSINAALELGLLEEASDPRLLFLQLPAKLPKIKLVHGGDGRDTTDRYGGTRIGHAKGKEIFGSSGKRTTSIAECCLEDLPRGYVGKMLVYKSGAVKLKLGDTLFDVSPGSECISAQNAVAMNTVSNHCCELGEIGKRAVVTPDIDFLLDSANQ